MSVKSYFGDLTFDDGFRSVCLSGIVSGSVAALQAYDGSLFFPWAAAAVVASVIDMIVGPIFRKMAAECKTAEANLDFEFQVAKTITVIGLTYATLLPSIGAAAAMAMSVNVFASTMVTIVANYINQKADKLSFTYWLIPSGKWLWATRLGAAGIVT